MRTVRVTKWYDNFLLLAYYLNKYLSNQVIFDFVRLPVDVSLD